jgi:signal peptidase I
LKKAVLQVLLTVFVVLVVFAGVQFTMQSFRVEGRSMQPSYEDNEYIVVDKLTYRFSSPQRGDVIVFHNPSRPTQLLLKRIVGMPGETIEIRHGEVYIDGEKLEESPEFGALPYEGYLREVPTGEYWVIGDNRQVSSGSHIFGTVSRDDIIGKARISYWPPREWGLSPSYAASVE